MNSEDLAFMWKALSRFVIVISFINKMAWNGQRLAKSTCEALPNLHALVNTLWRECKSQEISSFLRLNHCDSINHYCASLAEEDKEKDDDPADLATGQLALWRCCLANQTVWLVMTINAGEWLIGLIPVLGNTYSRVMNKSFCTGLMGTPFFPVPPPHMEYYHTPWYQGTNHVRKLCINIPKWNG